MNIHSNEANSFGRQTQTLIHIFVNICTSALFIAKVLVEMASVGHTHVTVPLHTDTLCTTRHLGSIHMSTLNAVCGQGIHPVRYQKQHCGHVYMSN